MHAPAKFRLDLKAPHTRYQNAAGDVLPGVTTVLGVLNKPPLLDWAARVERDGVLQHNRLMWSGPNVGAAVLESMLPVDEEGKPLYFYAAKRDAAADAGTIAHARIHAHLRNLELDEEGLPPAALELSHNGYRRWLDWWTEQNARCVATELALVSEALQVGGTLDIVAETPQGLTLADVKTTKRPDPRYWPYHEMVGQVAAYQILWNESHPWDPIRCACICRVGKEADDPGEVTWLTNAQLAAGADLFRGALAAYRAKQAITKAGRTA